MQVLRGLIVTRIGNRYRSIHNVYNVCLYVYMYVGIYMSVYIRGDDVGIQSSVLHPTSQEKG